MWNKTKGEEAGSWLWYEVSHPSFTSETISLRGDLTMDMFCV